MKVMVIIKGSGADEGRSVPNEEMPAAMGALLLARATAAARVGTA